MSDSQTTTASDTAGAAPPSSRPPRRLGVAGRTIDTRIGGPRGLQSRHLQYNESAARGQLAALRKAASQAPGENPEVWGLTEVKVPEHAGDAPTWEEIAVHTAMTLYAVHQQSRTEPMFVPGRGLGGAARALIGVGEEENPSTRARFNALVTSTSITELQHHLRGFISQLRAKSIPLDHAMLADDLVTFQRPDGAKTVRLRWSRQFASLRTSEDPSKSSTPSTSSSPTSSTPEN
ncbi:type I-E CRISPR-associated protein Cse2/CasB [Actinomyces timonensis]|uniref:Type I-E CRISPR-associated protein Cse2/CasB n=1 Tax=Actinomyces timonensis TaxID=1288391 RepID=A0AAU8N7X9_9ACTO